MSTHVREMIEVVTRQRHPKRRRSCVTCGARYGTICTVHPDPRCPRCATGLAYNGDRDAELGAGD